MEREKNSGLDVAEQAKKPARSGVQSVERAFALLDLIAVLAVARR